MKARLQMARRGVEGITALIMIAMVALTFTDVIGRRIFASPVFGAHDITEHLMAVIVFLGLPLVTLAGAHLTVDLLDKWIERPGLAWWRILSGIACAAILALVAWLFWKQAGNAAAIREVSQALRLPRAPLYMFMAASCLLAACAALWAAIRGPVAGAVKPGEGDV